MPPKKPIENKKETTNATKDSPLALMASLASPPEWFQSELEKGFAKIQVMLDGRLCEIRDSVDKVHSDLQETRQKLTLIMPRRI